MTLAGTLIIALALPFWTLKVVLFFAASLIWLAFTLCLVDAVVRTTRRRRERLALDRLWEDDGR